MIGKGYLVSLLLVLNALVVALGSASSPSGTMSVASPIASMRSRKGGGGGNPVGALLSYVKESMVRTVDGCGQLWTNHKRCNQIRAKQKDFRDKLQLKWEMEGRMTKEQVKQRLKTVNGGITYDDYAFLAKGKDDRGRLMNICFLVWGAPRFLPYALMFYPEMLPSTFVPPKDGSARESGLEKLSRERSHAVIQTLLDMEKEAKIVPSLAKINIFGKNAQERRMDAMQMMGDLTSRIMTTPSMRGPIGAQFFLNSLEHYFFRPTEISRAENRLIDVPKSMVRGAVLAAEGPSPLTNFLPNFMNRGKVISHIKKISDCDEFLINAAIHLSSLDSSHLIEACNDRFIGGPGRTDDELRESLGEWLNLAVVQPNTKLQQAGGQQFYNANLARFSLLCYNALDAARDERSASYLPRNLFQGQMQNTPDLIEGQTEKTKKNKS